MQYNEIIETIHKLTGIKARQRDIAGILGLRVNAVGLRAARGSDFSAEDMQKIGSYYNIDLFGRFKAVQNADEDTLFIADNIQKDEDLKALFSSILSLSDYNRKTVAMLAERLNTFQNT